MSENNNEADALFATRRKKQQDEEAQKAAKIAEEETGSTDYKFEKYGDNKYYITNSLDTIGEDDYMTSIFVGKKDDMYLEAYFYVSPSDEGKSRYIDFDDILEIFDVMLTHMSIG